MIYVLFVFRKRNENSIYGKNIKCYTTYSSCDTGEKCDRVKERYLSDIGGVLESMAGLVNTLLVISAIVLIVLVLLQSGKSAGLSGAISGGAEQLFRSEERRVGKECRVWLTEY